MFIVSMLCKFLLKRLNVNVHRNQQTQALNSRSLTLLPWLCRVLLICSYFLLAWFLHNLMCCFAVKSKNKNLLFFLLRPLVPCCFSDAATAWLDVAPSALRGRVPWQTKGLWSQAAALLVFILLVFTWPGSYWSMLKECYCRVKTHFNLSFVL